MLDNQSEHNSLAPPTQNFVDGVVVPNGRNDELFRSRNGTFKPSNRGDDFGRPSDKVVRCATRGSEGEREESGRDKEVAGEHCSGPEDTISTG